jgi:hypothetical protein
MGEDVSVADHARRLSVTPGLCLCPAFPISSSSVPTQLSRLWLTPRAESIREPADPLAPFITLPLPLVIHCSSTRTRTTGRRNSRQAPDKRGLSKGPVIFHRPDHWPLCWPGLAVCRCHSATPSPTGRLFLSRVAGLYWQINPSSYQRRHLPVASPLPLPPPLFKVQSPHCHPPRRPAHTPMQPASGEPRTKTTSRLPCQW